MEKAVINNQFYDDLKERWHTANDHPIALLRAENAVRLPWIAQEISKKWQTPIKMLDMGCGAGFLTNYLAKLGHSATGIDLSTTSLEVAKKHDSTNTVNYLSANAYEAPFADQSFDVISAMDILEHVEQPARLIQEASRLLKPQGLFFFHTFNRNALSYIIVIKGVEWFVKNTPPHMHVYDLFIKPQELQKMCLQSQLQMDICLGFMPKVFSKAFWQLLLTREVPKDFQFVFTSSLATGYCGIATKHPT
jgi:2-polyprenyl-6-hydroxyphenyl methylase/3-demethylubiquinone-9 3-methyltransferase